MEKIFEFALKHILGLQTVLAQINTGGIIPPSGGGGITFANPLSCNDLPCVGTAITNFLYVISIPILTIMVFIGGFQILTSGGNPERAKTGRNTLLYAAIGFAVVLIASGVSYIVKDILGAK